MRLRGFGGPSCAMREAVTGPTLFTAQRKDRRISAVPAVARGRSRRRPPGAFYTAQKKGPRPVFFHHHAHDARLGVGKLPTDRARIPGIFAPPARWAVLRRKNLGDPPRTPPAEPYRRMSGRAVNGGFGPPDLPDAPKSPRGPSLAHDPNAIEARAEGHQTNRPRARQHD